MSGDAATARHAEVAARLLPRPRALRPRGDTWRPRGEIAVAAPAGTAPRALARLEAGLAELGLPARTTDDRGSGIARHSAIRLALEPDASRKGEQGYSLRVHGDGVELSAAGEAGLFYGVTTLLQWLGGHTRDGLPAARFLGVEIEDHPDFAERGFLLDVSRNKVPRLATLFELVDRMAAVKLNQLQLYTEHTFAYPGHEVVWGAASPLSADDVRALDRYAAARHVELVPNQNSFGHFHRWLVHPPYRELAECPEGVAHPFSDTVEPFSLCPVDPRSLELLADLYGKLLPHFSSRRFNVGLDETLDLGRGRSRAACEERGVAAVYLDFLRRIAELARGHGREIQFWADVLLEHPERLAEIPAGATPLVWGYEADHPWAAVCAPLAASGRPFYVCPGTSSWLSLGGRVDNALGNLAAAAREGAALGAAGYLITDWGDQGHLQPLAVSFLGLLAGAAFSWNRDSARAPRAPDWATLLDRYAFDAEGVGEPALALGNAYLATGTSLANGTVLGRLLLSPQDALDHPRYERMHDEGLANARLIVADARDRLAGLRPSSAAAGLAIRELLWTADLLAFACRLGQARLTAGRGAQLDALPAAVGRSLGRALGRSLAALPEVWLARNRNGGLADSRERLARLARQLDRDPAA